MSATVPLGQGETLMFSSVFCTPQFSAKRAKARTTNNGEIRHDDAAAAHDYDVEVSDCGEGKGRPTVCRL